MSDVFEVESKIRKISIPGTSLHEGHHQISTWKQETPTRTCAESVEQSEECVPLSIGGERRELEGGFPQRSGLKGIYIENSLVRLLYRPERGDRTLDHPVAGCVIVFVC